jgi:hypothetical protein
MPVARSDHGAELIASSERANPDLAAIDNDEVIAKTVHLQKGYVAIRTHFERLIW